DHLDTSTEIGKFAFWDLVFYLSFGVVVTSSVATAGVLLVFCFLIVPALVGGLFSSHIGVALVIGWIAGAAASAAGIFRAFLLDAPTGAVKVVAFAAGLLVAGAIRAFITAPAAQRSRNRTRGLHVGVLVFCTLLGLSGAWVVVAPAGDHPILAMIETATGLGPDRFMSPSERAEYLEAAAIERRHKGEIDRLYDRERQSRWQGDGLTSDEIRRIGSMQQTLTEMGRGERFVMDYLRTRGRERERWYVGLPLAAVGFMAAAPIPLRAPRARQAARGDGGGSGGGRISAAELVLSDEGFERIGASHRREAARAVFLADEEHDALLVGQAAIDFGERQRRIAVAARPASNAIDLDHRKIFP